MYNPAISIRHQALKLAAIGLCSIIALTPPVSRADAQSPPAQPQATGTPVPATPAPPSNLYDWENTQGMDWNRAIKSEQQVMAEFQSKVKQAILKASAYPPLIGRQADKTVELAIQIDSDGKIGNIDVNNSSGHKQFDAALMLAAKKISEPLMPPHDRAVTLLIVFRNSELGKTVPAQDQSKGPAAVQPPVSVPPPPTQAAPANK